MLSFIQSLLFVSPPVAEAEADDACGQQQPPSRTDTADDERLQQVFKNTMISYIYRKRFLKLVYAATVLQRFVRQAQFKKRQPTWRTQPQPLPELTLMSDAYRNKMVRSALKYRSELLLELHRVDRIIRS